MSQREVRFCTPEHPLADGRVKLLGAVETVVGAMTHIEIDGLRLLADCGKPMGRAADDWVLPEAAAQADLVVLTHGHLDHVGALVELLQTRFDGPIVATRATLEIARIVLADSLRLQHAPERVQQKVLDRFAKLGRTLGYDATTAAASLLRGVQRGDGVTLALRDAGHILGSASLELCSRASRVIVSGDLGRPGTPILRDANTRWDGARPVDLVLMESTYGDRVHPDSQTGEGRAAATATRLLNIIKRALSDGGHILVPAFAIGRTQELLYYLNMLYEDGRIQDVPVAVDTPMGLSVLDIYNRHRRLYDRDTLDRIARGDAPLDFEGLSTVARGRDSERLRHSRQSMIIIAGSGMCQGGRIAGHLKELLPKPETNVLFVGFQAPGTPGHAILEAAGVIGSGAVHGGGPAVAGTGVRRSGDPVPRVRIDGEDVEVRAVVEVLQGLSAHADQRELAAWADAIPGVKCLALHHGEKSAQQGFATWLNARA